MWLFGGTYYWTWHKRNAAWTSIAYDDDERYLAFAFDMILGILGVGATLTAAKEFPHKHVKNSKGQSGTLHQKAIVTQSEMIEHVFYQGLNLVQAIYLHAIQHSRQDRDQEESSLFPAKTVANLGMLFMATSPWLVRRRFFPVHSFSANWKLHEVSKGEEESTSFCNQATRTTERQKDLEIILYKIKKWQYVFYKHVILHGVNLYVAVVDSGESNLPYSYSWRIFWLLLNTSYVMEFFLQSLVKKRRPTILKQSTMLVLQRWLMFCATVASMVVLLQLCSNHRIWLPALSLASLTLNFNRRGYDVSNTMTVAIIATGLWAFPLRRDTAVMEVSSENIC